MEEEAGASTPKHVRLLPSPRGGGSERGMGGQGRCLAAAAKPRGREMQNQLLVLSLSPSTPSRPLAAPWPGGCGPLPPSPRLAQLERGDPGGEGMGWLLNPPGQPES